MRAYARLFPVFVTLLSLFPSAWAADAIPVRAASFYQGTQSLSCSAAAAGTTPGLSGYLRAREAHLEWKTASSLDS